MTQNRKSRSGVRVGRLQTTGDIVQEMGRVYREARRGSLETSKASRLVYMLQAIRGTIEAGPLEERLAALEEAAGQ